MEHLGQARKNNALLRFTREAQVQWLSGRVLAYGAEVPWIEICKGPKISCYACCALGQGTLLSFLHSTQVN